MTDAQIVGPTMLMYSYGTGPTQQLHLSSGKTLFPISTATSSPDGNTTNVFAVPRQFMHEAARAGLETPSDFRNRFPQGRTSERPSTPGDQQYYFDSDLGKLIIWVAAKNAWVSLNSYLPSTSP